MSKTWWMISIVLWACAEEPAGPCECASGERCDSVDVVCRPACEGSTCTGASACVAWGEGGANGGPASICRPQAGEGTGEETGETRAFAATVIDVGLATEGTGPGIDLDGRTSDTTDIHGCGQADLVSPPPYSETGVDNVLGVLFREVGDSTSIADPAREAINAGEVELLFEVSGLDDVRDDPSVRLRMFIGTLEGTGRRRRSWART